MITLREYRPAAPELPIDGSRHPNRKSLHAARQSPTIARFRDQVQVVALHGEVDQTEAKTLLPVGQCALHPSEQPPTPQRRDPTTNAQRDMHRMMARMQRPAQVRDASDAPLRSPPSAGARATPRAKSKAQLTMIRARDHDLELADIIERAT